MIGDSAKDDIVSGNRAGAVTVLLDTEGKWGGGGGGGATDNGTAAAGVLEGEMMPTFIVASLAEVAPLLEMHFDLVSPGAAAAERAAAQ